MGWLEDIEHDIHERCEKGLPADKVFHSTPFQQRWWQQYQVCVRANTHARERQRVRAHAHACACGYVCVCVCVVPELGVGVVV